MNSRTISFKMDWKTAVEILLAALEDGTGDGKRAARKEVRRMAEILDSSTAEDEGQAQRTSLYEVIADHTDHGTAAYGVTFTDAATAEEYAETMRRLGYTVGPWPEYTTEPSLAAALDSARRFFEDDRIPQEVMP